MDEGPNCAYCAKFPIRRAVDLSGRRSFAFAVAVAFAVAFAFA
jgi:hypothetical protein